MKKVFILFAVSLVALMSLSSTSYAYVLTGYKFSNAAFTYDSSQLLYYGTEFTNAKNAWHNAYSKITWTFNDSVTEVSLYDGNYGNTDYNATTRINPSGTTTINASVSMNYYHMSGYSSTKNQAIITHELGHVLGLNDDNSDVKQIMCQDGYGRTATVPGSEDIKGAKALYP
ncbi:putative Zn-dependent protease [Paenibacillus shirakamiensis]|uniref:Zn-dependent protease n=1 Tax=Paenibacillus shirakamiensis TaxID=1265935 RepID=A0ABS4JFZ1_9BACL|nr:snapalysin family zinc-dependent metalloprotease [Paenibacillus shirakamiensis]MBP1999990.1 putative Zn-dependent protease [Paenibacillus shirakamiensis]